VKQVITVTLLKSLIEVV